MKKIIILTLLSILIGISARLIQYRIEEIRNMKQVTYFDEKENEGLKLLKSFDNSTHYFKSFTGTSLTDLIDVNGELRDGRNCSIEIKTRDFEHNRYDEIMIDLSKMNALVKTGITGNVSLLFCFFADRSLLIWDVTKEINVRIVPKGRVYDKGLGKFVIKPVVYLRTEDAILFYDNNGNWRRDY